MLEGEWFTSATVVGLFFRRLSCLDKTTLLVVITILLALCFHFFNGFHDAANSIAIVVSTRVLSPRLAVVWAAIFNPPSAVSSCAANIGGGA